MFAVQLWQFLAHSVYRIEKIPGIWEEEEEFVGVYPAFGELGGGQLLAVVLFDVAPVDLVD